MAEEKVTLEEIEKKMDRGEDLTEEEKKEIMSAPPPGSVDEIPDVVEAQREADIKADEELAKGTGVKKESKKEVKKESGEGDADKEKLAETVKGKKAEEKKSDTAKDDKEKAEQEKKDADTAKAEQEKADFGKVIKELDKAEGQADMSALTKVEKGFYAELRSERKKRQDVQASWDTEKFEKAKAEKAAKAKAEPEVKGKTPEDILKDLDDDDYPTKKQLLEVYKAMAKPAEPVTPEPAPVSKPPADPVQELLFESWAREAEQAYDDAPGIYNLYDKIITGNKEHEQEMKNASKEKKNLIAVACDLITKDPRFESLYTAPPATQKSEPKEDDDQAKAKIAEKAKKIADNAKKVKTSGNAGGGSEVADEYTIEEIVAMPPEEYAKLPAKTRQALLYKIG